MSHMQKTAYYHLPGLFEFYELYRDVSAAVPGASGNIFTTGATSAPSMEHRRTVIWGGGRVGSLEDHDSAGEVLALLREYGISARLTFSNSLLREEHLSDRKMQ